LNCLFTANRLTSVLDNGVITQYAYTGDGDRVSQTVGGVATSYVFDPVGLTQVLAETTAGQSKFYVPGLAQYGVTGWEYFAGDRLGSVRTLINPTGELTLARNYDPFGNVLVQGGVGSSGFGYTGEQTDASGLVYLRARYYAPTIGRFITPDPVISDPRRSIGWNSYAYVGNNPIRYIDPSGYCAEFGDEACWSRYEQLKRICPYCNYYRSVEGVDIPVERLNESQLDNLVQGLTGVDRPTAQTKWLDGTMSLGLGGTVDFPIEVVFGLHLLHVDEEFNFAAGTFYCGAGGASALGVTGGGSATLTNAENLGELQGWFVNGGVGVSEGLASGSVDGVVGSEGRNGRVFGGSVSLAGGPKLGIPLPPVLLFGHGNANYTTDFAFITIRKGFEGVCIGKCSLSSFDDQKLSLWQPKAY
jgi:RHS repeat-associated protein